MKIYSIIIFYNKYVLKDLFLFFNEYVYVYHTFFF